MTKSKNNLQKRIGVVFSIVSILGVLFVTIFWGKQSLNATSVNQASLGNLNALANSFNPNNLKVKKISAKNKVSATPLKPTISVITQTPPVDTTKKSVYKDGTYSATGSYMSPGGQDQIAVTLTLKNDIITDVSVTPKAGDNTSTRYMSKFVSGYKTYVVGKNIASVNLSRVSGSSLTPAGFNNALAKIKTQALA